MVFCLRCRFYAAFAEDSSIHFDKISVSAIYLLFKRPEQFQFSSVQSVATCSMQSTAPAISQPSHQARQSGRNRSAYSRPSNWQYFPSSDRVAANAWLPPSLVATNTYSRSDGNLSPQNVVCGRADETCIALGSSRSDLKGATCAYWAIILFVGLITL